MDQNLLTDHLRLPFKKLLQRPRIFVAIGILVSISATVYILFFTGPTGKNITNLFKKAPTVTTKAEFKNPFAKESQYINPFDQYKSPFYALKDKAK